LIDLSVRKNLTMTGLRELHTGPGILLRKKEMDHSTRLMTRLGIRAGSPEDPLSQLSGGNQQKVALAKWLGTNCRMIIMDEPTRGIDIGAKAEIYQLIRKLSGEGKGILIVSSEMIELMGLCDRILVMKEGRISGELHKHEFSEENILRLSIKNKLTNAK
jgi:ribose transport system ATP-binding protein